MNVLVTGSAGFIGSFLCKKILETTNYTVIGLDNLNDYYDVALKEARLESLKSFKKFIFIRGDISNKLFLESLFQQFSFDIVVNLAAQAGVRYSIDHPDVYITSNIIGFYNILEVCRNNMPKHLIFASSSSVYGGNSKVPFSVDDKVDNPVSLYAATKKSNELLAYSYSKLYGIPVTGLRFFTVYGPMGRPDMAYFSFTNKLMKGDIIDIFNYGNCKRDFTYIDDIVNSVIRIMENIPVKSIREDGFLVPPYRILNIGNGSPESLLDFVSILQEELMRVGLLPKDYDFETHQKLVPMQNGDVAVTFADNSELVKLTGFRPSTSLKCGLKNFVEWYKNYYFRGGNS